MAEPISTAESTPSALAGLPLYHPIWRLLLGRARAPQVSELTLGLLHKFNNQFTGVMFLTEECLARAQAGEEVSEQLQEIFTHLQQSHTFIDRITQLHLDDEEEDAGYHELDAVVAQQLDLARLLLPRGTALTHQPAAERLTFYASQKAVSEILLQLVGNCGQALPKRGGTVTISTALDDARPGFVAIEVRDNGPGFSAETLREPFTPFSTLSNSQQRAGLGLLRSRELARTFGGELTIANQAEGGAVAILRLPRDNGRDSR